MTWWQEILMKNHWQYFHWRTLIHGTWKTAWWYFSIDESLGVIRHCSGWTLLVLWVPFVMFFLQNCTTQFYQSSRWTKMDNFQIVRLRSSSAWQKISGLWAITPLSYWVRIHGHRLFYVWSSAAYPEPLGLELPGTVVCWFNFSLQMWQRWEGVASNWSETKY